MKVEDMFIGQMHSSKLFSFVSIIDFRAYLPAGRMLKANLSFKIRQIADSKNIFTKILLLFYFVWQFRTVVLSSN